MKSLNLTQEEKDKFDSCRNFIKDYREREEMMRLFNRQIKKMNQDGLPAKAATVNDWHEETCELIEPLFELQKERVFSSALLAADGSPFPIINNEKHKTLATQL